MIRNFKHKGLRELFKEGKTRRIVQTQHARAIRRLDMLALAKKPWELNIPGFDFHGLKGDKADRYSIHVNGNFCITFAWDGEDAIDVDYEDYH